MSEFNKEEILLFNTIIKVYKTNPTLALSCISEENIDRFELYLNKILGDKSLLVIQEIREVKALKKAQEVASNVPIRK